jgi:hypothetical protein
MTLTELHPPSTWPLALGIILLFAASWGVVRSPQSCDPFSSIVTQPVGFMDGRITFRGPALDYTAANTLSVICSLVRLIEVGHHVHVTEAGGDLGTEFGGDPGAGAERDIVASNRARMC